MNWQPLQIRFYCHSLKLRHQILDSLYKFILLIMFPDLFTEKISEAVSAACISQTSCV